MNALRRSLRTHLTEAELTIADLHEIILSAPIVPWHNDLNLSVDSDAIEVTSEGSNSSERGVLRIAVEDLQGQIFDQDDVRALEEDFGIDRSHTKNLRSAVKVDAEGLIFDQLFLAGWISAAPPLRDSIVIHESGGYAVFHPSWGWRSWRNQPSKPSSWWEPRKPPFADEIAF